VNLSSGSNDESHGSQFSNRIAFITLITGFLLSILFQIAFFRADATLAPDEIILLDFFFYSLLGMIFVFLFSFIFFLMASGEYHKAKKNLIFIVNCEQLGIYMSMVGIFAFAFVVYSVVSWYSSKVIGFIFSCAFLGFLWVIYFLPNWRWKLENDPNDSWAKVAVGFLLLVFSFVLILSYLAFTSWGITLWVGTSLGAVSIIIIVLHWLFFGRK
jgi:hypothetical protein